MKPYNEYQPTDYDWLPEIPKHWEKRSIRTLTKLSDERNGNREDLELLSVYREYGVIRKASRDDNHNVESLDLSNYKYVGKDYLVMNKMKMWQGSLGVSSFEGIVSPAYLVCSFLVNANYRYFHYLLRSATFKTQYNRISYGIRVGQWDMRYNDLKNTNLYIPPRSEQDQIVKFLDFRILKINKFIKDKKREIELLKELKQAEINRAVTKGLNPNIPMKDSGIEWLGEIPKHWDVRRLKNISFSIGDGLHGTPNYDENGIFYFINGTNLGEDDISITLNINTVNEEEYKKHYIKLNNNCILISLNGTIGKISFFNGESIILSKSSGYINLHDDENKNFIAYYLKSDFCKKSFTDTFKSTTINNLSLFALQNTKIIYPPLTEQHQIVEFIKNKLERINIAIAAIEKEITLISGYKTSLISNVVTGKVDVRDVKIDDIFELETLEETEAEIEAEEVTEE